MTDHSDYDTDFYDKDFDRSAHGRRSDDEWDGVWNTEARNRDTMRRIEIGLAVVAAAVSVVLVRAGWVRLSEASKHNVPSAADIHVRPPPPR